MDECVFCKIINGDLEAEIVYEDELVLAFKDIDPKAAVHLLIIPKEHIPTILDLDKKSELISHIYDVVKILANEYDIAEDGFRVVNNCNEDGGQIVFHLHFHLLGGEKLGDLV
ncbi:MAG: histidine triad nucleotide-binding protein [Bacillota bacterium]